MIAKKRRPILNLPRFHDRHSETRACFSEQLPSKVHCRRKAYPARKDRSLLRVGKVPSPDEFLSRRGAHAAFEDFHQGHPANETPLMSHQDLPASLQAELPVVLMQ